MQKNEIVAVNTWRNDLKREAQVQCKLLANSCLQSLKHSAGEFARKAVHCFFDHLIDNMNARLSA